MKEIKFSTAELFALQEALRSVDYLNFTDDIRKAVYLSVNNKVSNALSGDEEWD